MNEERQQHQLGFHEKKKMKKEKEMLVCSLYVLLLFVCSQFFLNFCTYVKYIVIYSEFECWQGSQCEIPFLQKN